MNISLQKKILKFFLFLCFLFFNVHNSYAKVTECYYLLPNSNVHYYREIYRNPVASNEQNRYFYRIVIRKNSDDIKSWNNGQKRNLNAAIKKNDYLKNGCPKYLDMTGEDKDMAMDYYSLYIKKGLNEQGDNTYNSFINSYYNISTGKSPIDFGTAFKINYKRGGIYADLFYLPEPIFKDSCLLGDRTTCSTLSEKKHFYIPLYYYDDDNSGTETKCYLSDMLNKNATSDCTVSYSGNNPARQYTIYTVDAYSKIASSAINDFKTSCASGKTDEYNKYLDDVIGFARNNNYTVTDGANEECIAASKNLGRLSAAILGWSTAFSLENIDSSYGETDGFKSYKEIYESLNETSENFSQKLKKFLFLYKLPNVQEITNEVKEELYLHIYGSQIISEAEDRFQTISNYSSICNYVSYEEHNQCMNTYNSCYSDTNMDQCLRRYSNMPSIQQSACYGALDVCMKQTVTSWDDAKSTWSGAVETVTNDLADANRRVAAIENVSIELNVYNPLHGIGVLTTDPVECSDIIAFRIIWIIIEIGAPIIVVALGMFDFASAVVAGDEKKISAAKQKFPKRLIALVILIILPIIIKILVGLISDNNVNNLDLIKCIVNGE